MPPARALREFEKLRGKGLDRPRIALAHAGLLARAGRLIDAEVKLRSLLLFRSTEWEARRALMKLATPQPDGALVVPRGVLPLPRSACPPELAGDIGTGLVLMGERESAGALLKIAASTSFARAEHLWAVAQVHYAEGRLEAAREALDACVAAPEVHPAWFGDLGAVLCDIGRDWQEAEWAFSAAIEGIGRSRDYLVGRAWARGMQGNRVGALADVEACLLKYPKAAEAWRLLGELAVRFELHEDLRRALDALQQLDPAAAEDLKRLAETSVKTAPPK